MLCTLLFNTSQLYLHFLCRVQNDFLSFQSSASLCQFSLRAQPSLSPIVPFLFWLTPLTLSPPAYVSVDGDLSRPWLMLAQPPPPFYSRWWWGSLRCDTEDFCRLIGTDCLKRLSGTACGTRLHRLIDSCLQNSQRPLVFELLSLHCSAVMLLSATAVFWE